MEADYQGRKGFVACFREGWAFGGRRSLLRRGGTCLFGRVMLLLLLLVFVLLGLFTARAVRVGERCLADSLSLSLSVFSTSFSSIFFLFSILFCGCSPLCASCPLIRYSLSKVEEQSTHCNYPIQSSPIHCPTLLCNIHTSISSPLNLCMNN